MKKILLTLIIIICANGAFAQEFSKEQLEKIVDDLLTEIISMDSCHYSEEKIRFCEAINNDTTWSVDDPWEFIDIKVLGAIGDRKEQNVTVELLLTNTGFNQNFYIDVRSIEGVDAIGNSSYTNLSGLNVGRSDSSGKLYANVPLKVEITLRGIMPGTEKFNVLAFMMGTSNAQDNNYSPKTEQVEIRNIPIVW